MSFEAAGRSSHFVLMTLQRETVVHRWLTAWPYETDGIRSAKDQM
jgi:hypothetical protein